ncbi:MAG: trypsin-like peptidase domain-containing protein [Anaerolineales bacterium]|nr:trypsin-like peptidase domain-containing protein [Anaerolineales bacterium]
MTDRMKTGIARIFLPDRKTINGMGIVVSREHVLTCAHVVEGIVKKGITEVWLDFPLIQNKTLIRFSVKIKDTHNDVAVLAPTDTIPEKVSALSLQTGDELSGHNFSVFGFPKNYDKGVWVNGKLMGKNADGWVQMNIIELSGYVIAPGFSGGPVWDETLGGVVGMVVATDSNQVHRAGYCIPTTILSEVFSELSIEPSGTSYPDTVHGHLESAKLLINEIQEIFHEPSVWPSDCKIAIEKIRAVRDVHLPRSFILLDSAEMLNQNQRNILNGLRVSKETIEDDIEQLISKVIAFEEIAQDNTKETKRENQQILTKLDRLKTSLLLVSE